MQSFMKGLYMSKLGATVICSRNVSIFSTILAEIYVQVIDHYFVLPLW
jgi:hypothetical protein